jgi:rhamnulose-1-phosphate aldolase/alcohol dehydrogenase
LTLGGRAVFGYKKRTVDNRWDDAVASKIGDDLDRLLYFGRLVGGDPSLFQAGGGGVSLKRRERDFAGREIDVLWVKGTGASLLHMDRGQLAPLRLDELRLLRHRPSMSEEELRDFTASCMLDVRAPRPSVQAPIHAFLPAPCIVHTLDFATQALTDTTRKGELVRQALGDDVLYLGYIRPGFPLAKAVQGIGDPGKATGLVLGKHGLVTWGATPKEAYDALHRLINRAEEFLRKARARKDPLAKQRHPAVPAERRREAARGLLPLLRGLLSIPGRTVLCVDDSDEAIRFANSELARQVHRRGMAAPEYILQCGRLPMHVDASLASLPASEAAAVLRRHVETFENDYRASFAKHGRGDEMLGPGPKISILPGIGIVAAGRDRRSAETSSRCYRHVASVIEAAETVDQFRFLEEAGAFEFEYWPLELERLRRPETELSRRVAFVTGAAGGIGRAIAERFATEGAHVILTDLDEKAVHAAAESIRERTGDPHRAVGLRADATSEDETAAAFDAAVFAYGGVDILVCNAGFVQPAPFADATLDSWKKHLDVNVTGYFIAVKEAVRIMKVQGFGTILFNASKAAFAAPKENAPYAASKAASVHLARCLALELAPAGIRVNYFNADFIDTPMIRKMCEERAAQKGITPDEQMEEYRKRNLLRVGPIPPEAVAEAALFLVSDRSRYTTGSCLTIDGGLQDAMPR